MTSRNLVMNTLEFTNIKWRVPRNTGVSRWAEIHYPNESAAIRRDYPDDIVFPQVGYAQSSISKGDMNAAGVHIDPWGCKFTNICDGIIGEVKDPLIPEQDENWDDTSAIHIPTELLSFDIDEVNAFCRNTDKFVLSGFFPRPFEQLQFIRGTEQLLADLMLQPKGMRCFIEKMHAFYCEGMEKWSKTEVDSLFFMDDWGTQRSLLVNPNTWKEMFMPLYKDYVDIAHRAGKKILMHSDGQILAIFPYLIEMGVDAISSQVGCMGTDNLARYRGKITFWGEIDRQHALPYGTEEDIRNIVQDICDKLWQDGGCLASCEFGAGAKPENVRSVYRIWNEIRGFNDAY